MKVHYINILLFALPLNILVSSKKNPYITHKTPRKKAIGTHRTLCECEWYAPSNCDNDPEMKEVKENYNRQASERFKEYDERMNKNRKKCKEQCDKEIQKIILKEKIEKELTEKFATLDTNITTNDIPTCVCEKSLADKAENFCLKCGYELGGGVLQASSLLGGIGEVALDAWKAAALVTTKELAEKAGAAAGIKAGDVAGMNVVIGSLKHYFYIDKLNGTPLQSLFTPQNYTSFPDLANVIHGQYRTSCNLLVVRTKDPICNIAENFNFVAVSGRPMVDEKAVITEVVKEINRKAVMSAAQANSIESAKVTAQLTTEKTGAIEAGFNNSITSIYAPIIAIVIIVLIMVIIYLILRYRRKKKMKKKLQYIKLLKE